MSDHAISNARGWAATICEAINAVAELEGGAESVTYDCETFDDADALRERIQEKPLSVRVRGGWYSPGEEKPDPEEYEILLSTGGPALRITGELDAYGQPDDYPNLQWQDWGTPWTTYRETSTEEDSALVSFARLFWFGE